MPQPVNRLAGLDHEIQTMPFDQFGRYHMLREAVDACRSVVGDQPLKILDVGGYYFNAENQHVLPILPFLPHDDVLVIDTVDCELPHYQRGDGTKLDFADGAFDFVVTADTLEHIPRPNREAFWHELLRVAQHGVILLAPFASPQVESAEALLNHFIKTYLHSDHVMLNEHVQYGLPRLDEWLPWLNNAGFKAKSYPTGYVHAWIGMMMIKHLLMRIAPGAESQYRIDSYYNQHFFPTERRNPAYRHMIFVAKTAGLGDAVDHVIAPTIYPDHEDVRDWGNAVVPTLLTVMQSQIGDVANQAKEQVHHQQLHIDTLTDDLRYTLERLKQSENIVLHIQQHQGFLERVIADQQIVLNQQAKALADRSFQHESTIHDLQQRSAWLEQQNNQLRQQLEAIQNGRVMQFMRSLSRRR
ncbi:MAG: methyltransferase domain-containing protein [Herpetosiphon sp.]|nr:methyltransferase domain-containing protein [Herpetosiphon sp.]